MKTASFLIGLAILVTTVAAASAQQAAGGVTEQKIQQLINQLGDDDWNKRVAATDELKKIGKPALPQLKEAMNSPNEEIRARAQFLVKTIEPAEREQQVQADAGDATGGVLGQLMGGGGQQGLQNLQVLQGGNAAALLRQLLGGQVGAGALGGFPGVVQGRVIVMDGQGRILGGQGIGAGGQGVLDLNALLQQALGAQGGAGVQGAGNVNVQGLLQQLLGGNWQGLGGLQGLNQLPRPDAAEVSVDLTDTFGAKLSESGDGLRVTEVKLGTRAAKTGLMIGDIITSVNGRVISKIDEAKETLGKLEVGKTAELEVTRRGETVTLTVPAS